MITDIYELTIDYLDPHGELKQLLMSSDSEEKCKQVLATYFKRFEHIVTAFSITHRFEWTRQFDSSIIKVF